MVPLHDSAVEIQHLFKRGSEESNLMTVLLIPSLELTLDMITAVVENPRKDLLSPSTMH